LAQLLGDLVIELAHRSGTAATLTAATEHAVFAVPGARWAGNSMVKGRHVTSEAPTDPLVAELDELQNSLDEGPCLSALREHRTIRIDDTTTDPRWRRYGHAAAQRGAHAVLSFRLFVHEENLGALNL
jgi:GAF domain-containing protein